MTQADDAGAFSGLRIQIRDFFGPGTLRIRAVGETSGLSAQVYFRVHTNWDQFHANADHTADNEFENVIRPGNVDLLVFKWIGPTFTQPTSSVVQVDGVVYVGTASGHSGALVAFDESGCGGQKCRAIWVGETAAIYGTPAVAEGAVFVGGRETRPCTSSMRKAARHYG